MADKYAQVNQLFQQGLGVANDIQHQQKAAALAQAKQAFSQAQDRTKQGFEMLKEAKTAAAKKFVWNNAIFPGMKIMYPDVEFGAVDMMDEPTSEAIEEFADLYKVGGFQAIQQEAPAILARVAKASGGDLDAQKTLMSHLDLYKQQQKEFNVGDKTIAANVSPFGQVTPIPGAEAPNPAVKEMEASLNPQKYPNSLANQELGEKKRQFDESQGLEKDKMAQSAEFKSSEQQLQRFNALGGLLEALEKGANVNEISKGFSKLTGNKKVQAQITRDDIIKEMLNVTRNSKSVVSPEIQAQIDKDRKAGKPTRHPDQSKAVPYKSAEEVRAAYQAGVLSREEAKKQIQGLGGLKP